MRVGLEDAAEDRVGSGCRIIRKEKEERPDLLTTEDRRVLVAKPSQQQFGLLIQARGVEPQELVDSGLAESLDPALSLLGFGRSESPGFLGQAGLV
jgi:hypothetical protein